MVLGVTETSATELSQLIAGDFRASKKETIKTTGAEKAYTRGMVMARRRDDGKYAQIALYTAVEDEDNGDGDGSTKVFDFYLAHHPVIPGTVTVKATVGAAEKNATDDYQGKFKTDDVEGHIDYKSGRVHLEWATAPDNATDLESDYNYGDANDLHIPAAILIEAVTVADDADGAANMYFVGEFISADLTWPDGATAAQKSDALSHMRERGMIVK